MAASQLIERISKKAVPWSCRELGHGQPAVSVGCSLWHLNTWVWALENLKYMGTWRGVPQIYPSASQSAERELPWGTGTGRNHL